MKGISFLRRQYYFSNNSSTVMSNHTHLVPHGSQIKLVPKVHWNTRLQLLVHHQFGYPELRKEMQFALKSINGIIQFHTASSDSRISLSVSSLGSPRTLSAVPTWARKIRQLPGYQTIEEFSVQCQSARYYLLSL
jgi:hypothetical protein